VLPGKLRVPRRAAALRRMLVSADKTTTDPMAVVDWINMFALAVNEENAAGGRVVTAPTNGACGIVPAVLAYYDKFIREVNANSLARYLLVTSAIGSLYKMNASISGADLILRILFIIATPVIYLFVRVEVLLSYIADVYLLKSTKARRVI
jgi:L-serine dehydratase